MKVNALTYNPSDAADCIRMSHEWARFLADPGRKYKAEMQLIKDEAAVVNEQADEEIRKRQSRIEELEGQIADRNARDRAMLKVAASFCILLGAWLVIGIMASRFGEGENLYLKTKDSWAFLAGVIPSWLIISWLIIGKESLQTLGWPFTKIFKADTD